MLEVAPFAPELGAEEHAGPFRIAEPRHELVAIGRRKIADVREGFDAGLAPFRTGELRTQVVDGLARLGEDEDLLAGERTVEQLAKSL